MPCVASVKVGKNGKKNIRVNNLTKGPWDNTEAGDSGRSIKMAV